jgi:hypothetical protein
VPEQADLFPSAVPAAPPATAASLDGVPERALSLTQPWASLVALGAKRIETRSWFTAFRGPVAIHASKLFPPGCREHCLDEPFLSALDGARAEALPRGRIVAVARLVECFRFGDDPLAGRACAEHEGDFGDYSPGRFGLVLADVVALPEPIPARGMLGLWALNDELRAAVAAQIAARSAA